MGTTVKIIRLVCVFNERVFLNKSHAYIT